MLNKIYDTQKEGCEKAIASLKRDFTTLRTGKVNINILDNVMVDYYGSPTPLNQVATVLTSDASTIAITPWEKSMIKSDLISHPSCKYRRQSKQRRRER